MIINYGNVIFLSNIQNEEKETFDDFERSMSFDDVLWAYGDLTTAHTHSRHAQVDESAALASYRRSSGSREHHLVGNFRQKRTIATKYKNSAKNVDKRVIIPIRRINRLSYF